MNRLNALILILSLAFLSGCAVVQGHYDERELNSDLEYNPIDGRWYHSTPPKSRDMMSFDDRQND